MEGGHGLQVPVERADDGVGRAPLRRFGRGGALEMFHDQRIEVLLAFHDWPDGAPHQRVQSSLPAAAGSRALVRVQLPAGSQRVDRVIVPGRRARQRRLFRERPIEHRKGFVVGAIRFFARTLQAGEIVRAYGAFEHGSSIPQGAGGNSVNTVGVGAAGCGSIGVNST